MGESTVRWEKVLKEDVMNKYTEIAGAAIGAVAGLALHGVHGMEVGAACGLGFALLGRRTEGGWILRSSELDSMRGTMHTARAAAWAVHPLMVENGGSDRGRILEYIHEKIVDPEAKRLKILPTALYEHLEQTSRATAAPYSSLRHVKRKLAPKLFRRSTDAIDGLISTVLEINREYGNYDVTRDWFYRWMSEIGVGEHAERLWDECFQGEPVRDMVAERGEMMERAFDALHEEHVAAAE